MLTALGIAALKLFGNFGAGGLIRLVPEVFRLIQQWMDDRHEHRMTVLQLQVDTKRAKQNLDYTHLQGDIEINTRRMEAQLEAIKQQGKKTGIKTVDALNALVRPLITYWWMYVYTLYKSFVIWGAVENFTTAAQFAKTVWTPQDWEVLMMILGFWFVGRVFNSDHKKPF